jgi:glycosyltransferase involved in cell wall biosynthesis
MVRSRLAVVIPCHNETATIGPVVEGAAAHADVIVVDDRSSDSSRETATAAGGRVIPSAEPGYDGALMTGLRQAYSEGYDHVVTMDADGEHDPALVARFRQELEAGAGLVCGIRERPQRASEYVVAGLTRRSLGVTDLLCGMKGYSRPLLDRFLSSGAPLHINMTPAIQWRRSGGSYVEVAVTGTPRADAPRFGRVLRANWRILKSFGEAWAATR